MQFVSKIKELHSFERLFLAVPLLNFVPDLSFFSILFYIYLLFEGLVILKSGRIYPKNKNYEVVIIFFLSILLFSYLWGRFFGVTFSDWIRGALPFFFLLCWFLIPSGISTNRVFKLFIYATVIWLCKVILEVIFFPKIAIELPLFVYRLTFISASSILPYNLIVIPILLFVPEILNKKFKSILLFMLLVFTLWAGYRVQIGLIGVVILFYFISQFRSFANHIKVWHLGLFILGIVILFFSVDTEINLFATNLSRFNELSEEKESGRAKELIYAFTNFLESPLFGKGIGFQVPTEITTSGFDEMLVKEFPKTVGYMHNFVGYFIMNTGTIGIVAYLFLLFFLFFKGINHLPLWLILTYSCIVVFILVEATFRLIHFNILLVTLQIIFLNYNKTSLKMSAI